MKLRAENLIKTYKGRSVVKGISVEKWIKAKSWGSLVLTVPEKQLYMIVGLVKPNSEYISGRFEHHWLPDVQESTTEIGYLAQEAVLEN
jgi:lipopolysaccharide export system ATP-binding protein